MNKGRIIIITIGAIAIIGGGYYLYSLFLIPTSTNSSAEFVVPALTAEYTNNTYGFSLTMPEGFKARIMSTSVEGETILLEDQTGNGIQIMITPIDEDIPTLTKNRIQQDIPF